MSDALPLRDTLRFGTMIGLSDREQAIRTIESISRWGFEIVWTGDHVAFTGPINDPLIQLTYLSALNPKLIFGTSVYLLPLRHPVPVAKMVATVDRLLGAGHFIFGVGVGGEFAREYEACGVPIKERGGRATEAIQVIKRLWTEPRVEHRGKYYSFGEISMQPRPATPGGPPIWVGGRAEGPLKRAAHYGDGWMPYVVTAKRYAEGMDFIGKEVERVGRKLTTTYGSAIHLFCTVGASVEAAHEVATEHLSKRYAMDFREPARRYAALGRPADVAAKISEYIKAGARDIGVDAVCHPSDRDAQLEQFAHEVIPLLRV
jgi:alkanesulfonate monooxygenase SsuD/methylene tetrahydromethanopterin reductase-like flavin-dependent oxidoreductase (luciferase family)